MKINKLTFSLLILILITFTVSAETNNADLLKSDIELEVEYISDELTMLEFLLKEGNNSILVKEKILALNSRMRDRMSSGDFYHNILEIKETYPDYVPPKIREIPKGLLIEHNTELIEKQQEKLEQLKTEAKKANELLAMKKFKTAMAIVVNGAIVAQGAFDMAGTAGDDLITSAGYQLLNYYVGKASEKVQTYNTTIDPTQVLKDNMKILQESKVLHSNQIQQIKSAQDSVMESLKFMTQYVNDLLYLKEELAELNKVINNANGHIDAAITTAPTRLQSNKFDEMIFIQALDDAHESLLTKVIGWKEYDERKKKIEIEAKSAYDEINQLPSLTKQDRVDLDDNYNNFKSHLDDFDTETIEKRNEALKEIQPSIDTWRKSYDSLMKEYKEFSGYSADTLKSSTDLWFENYLTYCNQVSASINTQINYANFEKDDRVDPSQVLSDTNEDFTILRNGKEGLMEAISKIKDYKGSVNEFPNQVSEDVSKAEKLLEDLKEVKSKYDDIIEQANSIGDIYLREGDYPSKEDPIYDILQGDLETFIIFSIPVPEDCAFVEEYAEEQLQLENEKLDFVISLKSKASEHISALKEYNQIYYNDMEDFMQLWDGYRMYRISNPDNVRGNLYLLSEQLEVFDADRAKLEKFAKIQREILELTQKIERSQTSTNHLLRGNSSGYSVLEEDVEIVRELLEYNQFKISLNIPGFTYDEMENGFPIIKETVKNDLASIPESSKIKILASRIKKYRDEMEDLPGMEVVSFERAYNEWKLEVLKEYVLFDGWKKDEENRFYYEQARDNTIYIFERFKSIRGYPEDPNFLVPDESLGTPIHSVLKYFFDENVLNKAGLGSYIEKWKEYETERKKEQEKDYRKEERRRMIELRKAAGITPNSPFYFLDKISSVFSSPEKLADERAGEIIAMIEDKDAYSLDIAIGQYTDVLNKWINEVDDNPIIAQAIVMRVGEHLGIFLKVQSNSESNQIEGLDQTLDTILETIKGFLENYKIKPCMEYTAKKYCSSNPICIWDKSCTEKTDVVLCSEYESKEPCNQNEDCMWNDTTNSCDAFEKIVEIKSCEDYISNDQCSKNTECKWFSQLNKCHKKNYIIDCYEYLSKDSCITDSLCEWKENTKECKEKKIEVEKECKDHTQESDCNKGENCFWNSTLEECYEEEEEISVEIVFDPTYLNKVKSAKAEWISIKEEYKNAINDFEKIKLEYRDAYKNRNTPKVLELEDEIDKIKDITIYDIEEKLESAKDKLDLAIEILEEKNEEIRTALSSVSAEMTNKMKALEAIESKIEEKENQIEEKEKEVEKLEDEIEDLEEEQNKQDDKFDECEETYENSEEKCSNYEEKARQIESKIEEMEEGDIGDIEEEIEEIEKELEGYEEEEELLEDELSELIGDYRYEDDEIEDTEEEIEILEEKIEEINGEIEVIENTYDYDHETGKVEANEEDNDE